MKRSANFKDTSVPEHEVLDKRRRTVHHNVLFSSLVNTHGGKHREEKISTEGQFPCGAVEFEATGQDVEVALNDGMTTQVSIEHMQLFVCEFIDKNFEEERVDGGNQRKRRQFTRESR